jgi:cob(I)alamin adenosyltransferase
MARMTKVELLIDLTTPVEEIAAVINIMLQAYPDQQIEILQAVDHNIGDALAKLQASDKSEKQE